MLLMLLFSFPDSANLGALLSNKKSYKRIPSPYYSIRAIQIFKLIQVVNYKHVKGESGFKVWRYLLRRDDPAPAPWTKEGKQIAKEKVF